MASEQHSTASPMNEQEWGDLLYSIEHRKCIVVAGPEIYTAPGDEPLDKRLAAFLRKQAEALRIRVNDNGWFHLQPLGNETSPFRQVKEFYNRPAPNTDNLLKSLARIRFHLYVSLTPDDKLRQAFTGQAADFETYVRNKPYKEGLQPPTSDRPLVYQLLGNLEDRNSLVLTYDDFYDYLKSVFTGNSMSPNLKDEIIKAEYFLFLGMPFDQWYMHLFMRVLNQSKEKLQTQKVAVPLDARNAESCAEQYTIRFVDNDIAAFVAELLQRCEQHERSGKLLRPLPTAKGEQAPPDDRSEPFFELLTELLVDNRFEDIYEKVKKVLAGKGDAGRVLLQVFIQLKGRYTKLEEENSLGILHHEEYRVELAKIRKAFLDQINELRRQVAQDLLTLGVLTGLSPNPTDSHE